MTLINPGIKHIVLSRPPLKQAWDMLAIAQLLAMGNVSTGQPLSLSQKARCLKFYFDADGVYRLWAATGRSGSAWSHLAIALALDLATGGDGEYDFENQIFYPRHGRIHRRLDWRVPTGEWEAGHARVKGPSLGEQRYFAFHNSYFRLRVLPVKKMKTILVTRSIPAILSSLYFKFAQAQSWPEVTLDDEDSFDWDASLTKAIAFFNS